MAAEARVDTIVYDVHVQCSVFVTFVRAQVAKLTQFRTHGVLRVPSEIVCHLLRWSKRGVGDVKMTSQIFETRICGPSSRSLIIETRIA